jgi:dTDP-4-amino-4,6-dideoxygalactose transaminase
MTTITTQQQRQVPFLDLGAMHAEIREELDATWDEIVSSGAFIGGAALDRFEAEWAAYCGTSHAVGVGNGTDAIELVLRALDLQPGDEVIVPANTFIATAEAVVLAGGTPRFVDVDADTLLASRATIEPALSDRTAAIIIVHLFGGMPDMAQLTDLAAAAGIPLIEDAAQAHGATFRGRPAGSFGLAGCFSFYPGKNLGAFGDGGAVVTDDADLAERVRSYANHGRDPQDRHLHPALGSNSRLDGLQAAILRRKLTRLDDWNTGRRNAMARYRTRLSEIGVPWVTVSDDVESVHHLGVVRVRDRDAVRAALGRRGVQSGIHYPVPCHQQQGYDQYASEALPVAERAAQEILSLPMYPHLSEDDVDHVCAMLAEALEETGEVVGRDAS